MLNLGRMLILILLLATACLAQTQTVSLTAGTLFRNGFILTPPLDNSVFKFKLLGSNTEINGSINGGSGLNLTENNTNCCFYGKRFALQDLVTGRNNFQQTGEPIIVNGVPYNTVYFSGEIIFKGGTTVPFYLKKKQTQVLKFLLSTDGYLNGYATLADRNGGTPLFQTSLKMTGTATVTIRRNEQNQINHFDVVSVKYDLVSATD